MMNPEWGRGGRLPWPTRAQFEGWNAGLSAPLPKPPPAIGWWRRIRGFIASLSKSSTLSTKIGEESIPARWAESKQYARAFAAGREHRASMTAEEVYEMETRDE